ncbi:unnamed protein product [Rhizophagus irregularis]|nr:unnamed protein product [Rhizophagus irregularis]
MHTSVYCLREYGSFKVSAVWQDLTVLSEAIVTCLKFFTFMKENIEKKKPCIEQKHKLLAKRGVHTLKQNPQTPNRSKKQKNSK